MKQQNPELPADLAAAQEQFARWRAEHKPRTRFPDHLWLLAVELARQYGHNQVCRALKLDYYSLKKRLSPDSDPSGQPSTPPFIEIRPGRPAATGRCLIECENQNGNRIRIHLDGKELSELPSLCGELWSCIR